MDRSVLYLTNPSSHLSLGPGALARLPGGLGHRLCISPSSQSLSLSHTLKTTASLYLQKEKTEMRGAFWPPPHQSRADRLSMFSTVQSVPTSPTQSSLVM